MEYTCDDCGEVFELGPGTYLGAPDANDSRCNPLMAMTALCEVCYSATMEGEVEIEDGRI